VWRRGISYDKLGKYEAAVADFSRVLELEPTNSVAYFNRGSTYDSMGAHDHAIADFGRALELDNGSNHVSSMGGEAM
jgi:tetratricopeptide (TPR) repeat protein